MTKQVLSLAERFTQLIWCDDYNKLPTTKRFLIRALQILYAVIRDLRNGQLSLRAMSLVYTTVISLVPLLAVSFSVLKGFGLLESAKPQIVEAFEPLGDKKEEITEKIFSFVDNIQIGVLGAVGFALMIWSVISMMQKIESSFNFTWQVAKGRTLSQRFSDYLTVLMLAPLFIMVSIGITTSFQSNMAMEFLNELPLMGELLYIIGLTIPYFIMGAGFAFIYIYMPNTKVKPLSAFVGGITTAVIWKIMGIVFTAFVANSSSNTAIYSAFASIIIFMVWMYLGWLVLLIGTSISFYHQHPQNIKVRPQDLRLSNRVKEKLALTIMQLIGKHFANSKDPWTAVSLSIELDAPLQAIERELDILEEYNLVVKLDGSRVYYHPSRPLEKISLLEIIEAARAYGEKTSMQYKRVKSPKVVTQATDKMDKAVQDTLSGITLASLSK
jgi:membrane protein